MKFNFLYIVWLVALIMCFVIVYKFAGQSQHTFFGTAESEGQILNYEYSVLVEKIYIQTGDQVKQGDTLAVFLRSDLDRTASDKNSEIKQYEVEKTTKSNTFQREIDVLRARRAGLVSELESQIKMINTEDGIQSALKEAISSGEKKQSNSSNLKTEKINTLKESIKQLEHQIQQQIAQLNQQLNANASIYNAKVEQAEEQMSFIERDKAHLVLIAPIDGFVENVAAVSKEIAPQYKELIKLNPIYPNKIRGFMHESAEVHYVLGDTVKVSSTLRTNITTQGIIIGSSPQLVELPLRLRKFTTRSAWGREIYVRLLDNSNLFISEKVMITLYPNSTEITDNDVERVNALQPTKIAKNRAVSTRE